MRAARGLRRLGLMIRIPINQRCLDMIKDYNLQTHIKRFWNTLTCLIRIQIKYRKAFLTLNKTIRLAEKMILSKKIIWDDSDPFSKITISVIAKNLQTAKAVRLLCRMGLGQDALTQLRVMFEALIDFGYMRADKARVKDYTDFDLYYKLKLGRKLDKQKIEVDQQGWEARQRELETEWNKVRHRFTYQNPKGKDVVFSRWSGKDLRTMAEEINLEKAYDYFYTYASGFVHSMAASANDYVLGREKDSVVVEVGASETMISEALHTDQATLLAFLEIINEEYKVGFDKEINDLSPNIKKDDIKSEL